MKSTLLVLVIGCFLAFGNNRSPASSPPNLLLFLADDMTYTDVGCYGNPIVRTPHIDALASQGIRFRRCYNSAPTCSPLRQSLMTGLYPIRNGAHPNHSRVYDGVRSLPHYLSPLGYRTAIVGKRHEAPAKAFPFEMLGGTHHDSGKSPAGADLPLAKAREFIAREPNQPWCLFVTSNQPHSPWNRGDASAYPPDQIEVPQYLVDTPETRQGLSRYYAEITYMDSQLGEVLKHLHESGQEDNTVVVWLSEQGSQLPFGKWTCYEMGIHAAAVIRLPTKLSATIPTFHPPSVSDALISYVDIVPTFVELAGGDPTRLDVDGRSFAGLLRGETASHQAFVFATNTTRGIHQGSDAYATRSVTDGDWLYLRNLHADAVFQNMVTQRDPIFRSWRSVDSPFARERVRQYARRAATELYDLRSDPWCMNNRSGEIESQAIEERLAGALQQWMVQQGDQCDATERSAESRQPRRKPWTLKDGYALD